MGPPGASSALIPWDMVSADEVRRRFTVASDKRRVENGPVFGENQEVTLELENRVYAHYHGRGRATTTREIGGPEDEVRVPLTEEEVVVEKRPVAKEEIRLRKEVVEDVEVVEADVRREEIDVEDTSTTRRNDDRGL
jgi:uncharacterized protein (TIGR02271 family)